MTDAAPVPPAAGVPVTAPAGTDYPGKVLGIVGLVLSIVVGGLPGLIVSAIARSQSSKAGFTNTPATVGLVLGIVFTAIWVIVIVIIIVASAAIVASTPGYSN